MIGIGQRETGGRLASVMITCACLLSGCGSSQWLSKYEDGKRALATNPKNLVAAQAAFQAAIADAEKNHLPEPTYAPAVIAMGETLMEQRRFAEAQDYLLHAVSLATATDMTVAENVRLLKLLELAYEQARNYQQAAQTADVLVNFTYMQLSPLSTDYKHAVIARDKLKKLAIAAQSHDDCCEAAKPGGVQ